MAEEDVNYASVVFKTNKNSQHEVKKEEETVYDEVKMKSQATNQTGDTDVSAGILPDKKEDKRRRHYQHLVCCLGILCVILLLGVIAVCIYLTTLSHENELNQLKENQTSLLAVNHNLTKLNDKLSSEKEKLRRDHNNLTVQVGNLTHAYRVLESNITNLTAENQNLTTQKKQLETRNQELETEKNNLTQKIQDMETKANELNVSRAQWSINAYCRQKDSRECKPCEDGWRFSQSSCYAINNAESAKRRTWDEARSDCKGKISDLVVILNQEEKTFIDDNSWFNSGTDGYWIGLRVEDGKWKWVDGTDLTDNSWIQHPPTDGHCAISVQSKEWKSVNCGDKNMWVCEKKAVSV